MDISQKDISAGLLQLVEKGMVWAKCPKCYLPLSLKEYKALKCDTCGKIKHKGKEHITYHPKTDMC